MAASHTITKDTTPNYCVHGTYIGGPLGPDYLCGACEESISWHDYQQHCYSVNYQKDMEIFVLDLVQEFPLLTRDDPTWEFLRDAAATMFRLVRSHPYSFDPDCEDCST